ncbi:hypothetical protein BJY01DRAFT_203173 [Aspergillus pseudoustus]|uniref:NAD binding domain of 6-phosphogluconate dehydrogenase-domain-containing protein n=1 Tax=Aspergillus pseudoustus TaxID=1810923 RepID=A0ABR4KZF3_9EURO
MADLRIGWYGLGSMGLPMATNLQRHLFKNAQPSLTYYNPTMTSGQPLKKLGAIPATSLRELLVECDMIFTMFANDSVLMETVESIAKLAVAITNKIFVDCSTVHPDTTESVSRTISGLGAIFLSAPVFGGPAIAATGQLVFAIGGPGPAAAITRRYIQDVIGRMVIECGEEARNASLLKIGGNIITLNLMEAVGEAQVFAEQTGLGTAAMEQLITESFGGVAGGYSKRLTSGIYAPALDTRPGFGVSLAIKDAEHALSLASDFQVSLPSLEIAHNNMRASRDYAGECLDSSSMYGTLRVNAGLPFWNGTSRQG